jgi:beta-galactosidase
VLIRSTTKAGKIKVKAHVQFEGTQVPAAAEIDLESVPADLPFCTMDTQKVKGPKVAAQKNIKQLSDAEKQKLLDEVEKQQTEFGEKK